jgi:predicted RNase H-like nuclease (RuvC/YqgF family)
MSDPTREEAQLYEITRLRAEVEKLTEWNREIAVNARELVAEVEKLRAALEDIADGLGESELAEVGRYAKCIARAALEEK